MASDCLRVPQNLLNNHHETIGFQKEIGDKNPDGIPHSSRNQGAGNGGRRAGEPILLELLGESHPQGHRLEKPPFQEAQEVEAAFVMVL
jgi:hypothetical protein